MKRIFCKDLNPKDGNMSCSMYFDCEQVDTSMQKTIINHLNFGPVHMEAVQKNNLYSSNTEYPINDLQRIFDSGVEIKY